MTKSISNSDDMIDSRDVIERIKELESDDSLTDPEYEDTYQDERDELKALQALQEEAEGYVSDWKYGATLIRDDYFEDYARDLAEDIGAIKETSWPYTCIDWERAARELQQDYTSVDFDGVTYWVR